MRRIACPDALYERAVPGLFAHARFVCLGLFNSDPVAVETWAIMSRRHLRRGMGPLDKRTTWHVAM